MFFRPSIFFSFLKEMSPFSRGGESGDVKTMARPFRGTGFASHTYETLMEGGLCPESIKPLAKDWRGVWGVV
jgi:hypothetical protein